MKIIINYILIALCSITIPLSALNLSAKENSIDTEIVFTEESINKLDFEMGPDSPYAGQMLTYTVDDKGNIIQTKDVIQQRSISKIAVFVGKKIIGYIFVKVINGIVIAVTGQSGEWWASQAIQNVLNKPYTGRTYINCNVYPMHSYEGAMCRRYV